MIFLNMDHEDIHTYDQSRILFVNLIHSLVVKFAVPNDLEKTLSMITYLDSKEGSPLIFMS